MVEVRRGGERVEAEVTHARPRDGRGPPARVEFRPAGRRESPLDLRGTAGRVRAGRRPTWERRGDRSAPANVAADTVVRIDIDRPAPEETRAELARIFADRFGTDQAKRETARKLLAELPWDESMREIAWAAYKASPAHEPLRQRVRGEDRRDQGPEEPVLVAACRHEAGGRLGAGHRDARRRRRAEGVNDQQWRSMFERYYKPHPEAGGYVYLALRAPNDEWNGFYDDAICPLVERLIRQFVLFGDVNPDRVYILGASHGGYGAFVIGPKMPDRFAAVHASAAAATPGETRGENLRDVRFTVMVGEKDTAYGRADRCRDFVKELAGWKSRYGGYPGECRPAARTLATRSRTATRWARCSSRASRSSSGPDRLGPVGRGPEALLLDRSPGRIQRAGSRRRCATTRSRSRPTIRTRLPSGSMPRS